MSSISAIGILTSSTNLLLGEQSTLGDLSAQLSTGKKHSNLTEYATTDAARLLNFQSAITKKQGFITSMSTVQTRLSIYDTTMSDLETIAQSANTLASQNQNYDSTKLASLQAQALNYLRQVTGDLNQKVGDRYIFSGTRYSTQPLKDLTTLLGTAPSSTTVSSPALPDYDADYVTSASTNANAYTKDTVTIDQGYNVTYGVVSTDPSFQKLISGLRYIYQATTETVPANYQTDMTTGATLLASALNGMQTLHATVANNQNTLTTEVTTQNTNITTLQNQLADIQSADTTTVSASITQLQTQLSASYSATAIVLQMSILKYL